MKKILIYGIIFLVIIGGFCFAQQLYIGDYITIAWDPWPQPGNGTYTYEVGVIDRDGSGEPIIVDEVVTPPVTINISTYDFEVTFGVRTVLTLSVPATIDGIDYVAGDRVPSEWNFSDVNGVSTPNPFVASRGVHAPEGFRRQ